MSRPQHTEEPSLLHLLVGDCKLHVVFVHGWHDLVVLFGNIPESHFEHVEAPGEVKVKNPLSHWVQDDELAKEL